MCSRVNRCMEMRCGDEVYGGFLRTGVVKEWGEVVWLFGT